jgi:asparagine synthetase B (glutamine-hydrolysing)
VHRRLSIIDLSERASQPMASEDGRFVIVFNAEVYNYRQLPTELDMDGGHFRMTSDTEALWHLYAVHGAEMVHRLRGMFAFVKWDQAQRRFFLARDPYGIKPLYTANDGWTFRVASQVKALLAGGHISRDSEPARCGRLPFVRQRARTIYAIHNGSTLGTAVAEEELPDTIARLLAAPKPDPHARAAAERARFGRETFAAGVRAALNRLMDAT